MINEPMPEAMTAATLPEAGFISLADSARVLGVCKATVYRQLQAQNLPFPTVKVGSKVLVPVVPLRRLLETGSAAQ